jgi:hypothetical protein
MFRGFAVALAMLVGIAPALANCYEVIGCDDNGYFVRGRLQQLSCQSLWEVRNMIYKQNGYCFSTQRAKSAFGNMGCWITDQNEVKLNLFERENVALISEVEKAKNCR